MTEAAENSGSLITAKLALEFSKEVFAIPGDVGRPGSVGTNSLIRDGLAKCVLRPEEVLSEFFRFSASESGIGVRTNPYGQPFSNPSARSNSPLFRKIEELGMPDAESLSSALGIPVEEVIAELSGFEIEGTVASDHFGRYSIR
ncbi:MAG: processing protein [Patescibacteria group bacterium]|nr:processing protein [Patescibacteria group bacterium]